MNRDEELSKAHDTINALRQENERSKVYIQQYENQIRDMENDLNNLGNSNE